MVLAPEPDPCATVLAEARESASDFRLDLSNAAVGECFNDPRN